MDTLTAPRRALPRFKREQGTRRPAIQLQDRDIDLIKRIWDYRIIATHQLIALNGGSPRGLTRRLQVLFHNDYVNRKKLSNNAPILYTLGNKGADLLTRHYGIDRKKIDYTTRNRELTEGYVQHALMVTNFRVALELALKSRPQTTLHFWEYAGSFRVTMSALNNDGTTTETSIIPDAYFCLNDNGDLLYFFAECDRSKMTTDRYLKKLQAYHLFWKHEIHKKPNNPYHLPSFRILTLTISEQRKENLRKLAQSIESPKRQESLFWFLCEKHYRADPQALFQSLWQTPKDDQLRRLLDVS